MVLSNSKCMLIRIQNSEISIQVQYSTFHSNRSNSINSTIRNRLLLQLFVSEMIHAKQWHYSLQRLPVASFYSFYTKKSKGFFQYQFYIQKTRSSSIHSTYRRQGDLLSSLQRPTRHSRHSSRKTFQRHSNSTRTFQSFMTFQTFQSFMTFQPPRHFYTSQHFFNQNANSTHRLVSTRNSIEYQLGYSTNITFFKEREMLRYRSYV